MRGVEVCLQAVRQDAPPKIIAIDYEIVIDTDEDERRRELLHASIRKFGTMSNTVAVATELRGRLRRQSSW